MKPYGEYCISYVQYHASMMFQKVFHLSRSDWSRSDRITSSSIFCPLFLSRLKYTTKSNVGHTSSHIRLIVDTGHGNNMFRSSGGLRTLFSKPMVLRRSSRGPETRHPFSQSSHSACRACAFDCCGSPVVDFDRRVHMQTVINSSFVEGPSG